MTIVSTDAPPLGELKLYLDIGKSVAKLFEGLFSDKDYPWARVDIIALNAIARVHQVQVLDGQNSTQWRALGQELVDKLNVEFKKINPADRKGVTLPVIAIGYSSGRGKTKLGTGYFVSDDTVGFADIPDFKDIATLREAVGLFFATAAAIVKRVPANVPFLSNVADDPGLLSSTTANINTQLTQTANNIDALIATTSNKISDGIDKLVKKQSKFLNSTADIFDAGLDYFLGNASDTVVGALDEVLTLIDRSLSIGDALNTDLFDRIGDAVEVVIDIQEQLHGGFVNQLADNTESFFDAAEDVLDIIAVLHQQSLGGVLDVIDDVIDAEFNRITDVIESVIKSAESITDLFSDDALKNITEVLEKIAVPFDLNPLGLAISLSDAMPEVLDVIKDTLQRQIGMDPDRVNSLEQFLFDAADVFELGPDACKDRFSNPADPEEFGANFIRLVANLIAALMFPLVIAQARAAGCLQEWAQSNPYLMLPPPEAVAAFFRGFQSLDDSLRDIKGQGFSEDDAQKLIEVSRPIPDEELLLTMWLREFITEEQLQGAFEGKGWSDVWIENYKRIAFFIPPVQDLITMAVREVFDKEIAESFGQFDDFPEEFAEWTAKQGVSREWARNYWAAHWALPSIQMGFEMLHRRVIDETKLKQLMVALDIMPGWRDELIQISFNPFTRIDIRRMHRVGVLTDDEVHTSYLDLGYNDEKARTLQEFVSKLNSEEETLSEQLANDLTRSSILGFYDDGVINRLVAFGLLANSGYNAISIELFLESVDFDRERQERKADINIVLDQAKIGVIDKHEARSALDSMGLETRERELAMLDLERILKSNIKAPSKADLDKFVGAGLLNESDYKDELGKIGYLDNWVDKYWILAKG